VQVRLLQQGLDVLACGHQQMRRGRAAVEHLAAGEHVADVLVDPDRDAVPLQLQRDPARVPGDGEVGHLVHHQRVLAARVALQQRSGERVDHIDVVAVRGAFPNAAHRQRAGHEDRAGDRRRAERPARRGVAHQGQPQHPGHDHRHDHGRGPGVPQPVVLHRARGAHHREHHARHHEQGDEVQAPSLTGQAPGQHAGHHHQQQP
jgi:hypothetical protein